MTRVEALPDTVLLHRLTLLVRADKRLGAEISRHLAEVDRRGLYRDEGFASLFAYCVDGLGLSEPETQLRIHAARAMARNPELLAMLEGGETTLSAVARVAPILTEENRETLIPEVRGKTCREVEALVARVAPKPPRPDLARAMPPESPAGSDEAWPAAEKRYRVAFDASEEFWGKLEKARGLLSRRFPEGRYEDVLGATLDLLLEREDPQRRHARRLARLAWKKTASAGAVPAAPGAESAATEARAAEAEVPAEGREIPQALRDAVWHRDSGRCAFEGRRGRCRATRGLEVDHVIPAAAGGKAVLENLRLLCRTHNRLAAERYFGRDNIARAILDRRNGAARPPMGRESG
ncbi:MAG: HNH endonuclease [Elusimicrobia bacterium]|nr:HNH endonuclease [Elusimicrobiota bacterium]